MTLLCAALTQTLPRQACSRKAPQRSPLPAEGGDEAWGVDVGAEGVVEVVLAALFEGVHGLLDGRGGALEGGGDGGAGGEGVGAAQARAQGEAVPEVPLPAEL